jgi:hypothetical protein
MAVLAPLVCFNPHNPSRLDALSGERTTGRCDLSRVSQRLDRSALSGSQGEPKWGLLA